MPPCMASASVTTGLKCAPEIGPSARIRATKAAPVAMELARSASATLPPAKRSAMMPEPTMAISRNAVPRASVAARRTTASLLCVGWFHGAEEGAEKLSVNLRRDRVDVDSLPGEKFPRVLGAIDAGGFDFNLLDAGRGRLRED